MKRSLLLLLCLVLASAFTVGCSQPAPAEPEEEPDEVAAIDFPTKVVRVICPYAAGGGSDTLARALAEAAGKYLPGGYGIVVENVTGGSGVVGATELLATQPDGYNLMQFVNGVLTFQPHFGKATYTVEDFESVAGLFAVPNVFVVPADSPFETFEEVIEYCKANPGKFNYGSPGTGTFAQVAAAAVIAKAGIEMTHVPFDGSANTHTALLGKHVDGAAYLATDCKQYVDSGDFKVLWTTAETDMYPDAATTADLGIDYDLVAWTGLVGPAGMDEQVVRILTDAYRQALEDPATVELFSSMGYTGSYQDPATYEEILLDEFESNGETLKAIGLAQ